MPIYFSGLLPFGNEAHRCQTFALVSDFSPRSESGLGRLVSLVFDLRGFPREGVEVLGHALCNPVAEQRWVFALFPCCETPFARDWVLYWPPSFVGMVSIACGYQRAEHFWVICEDTSLFLSLAAMHAHVHV